MQPWFHWLVPYGVRDISFRIEPSGQPTPATSECMTLWFFSPLSFRTRRGPGCTRRGVDHPGFQIDQPLLGQPDVKQFEHQVERPAISPISKPLIDR